MILLEFRFPAGRCHATPWGRHVNEGAVEWPPSPWRILRALIATRHLKARTEVAEPLLAGLMASLAATLPAYRFPRATAGHTRHYMPYVEGSKQKTTKVFDTFVQLPQAEPLITAWDIDLPDDQFRALELLAERMGYFGRAESLVLATARRSSEEFLADAHPLMEGSQAPQDMETVRLLSPLAESAYQQWKAGYEAALATASSDSDNKRSRKTKAPDIPSDVFAALHADTGNLQATGWNLPPGSAWVTYARTASAFAPQPRPRLPQKPGEVPRVARYAVASTVPPSILDAVSVAERVHKSLCAWSDKGSGRSHVFTGLDDQKKPASGHSHAHVFCEANGTRGEITHITVWARAGFDAEACTAIRQLNRVWGHDGHDVRLVLESLGQEEDFATSPLFKPSEKWRSLTPFISTRHAKTYRTGTPKMDADGSWQIGSDGHDLIRLLALNPGTRDAKVERIDAPQPIVAGGRHFRALQFQTIRHGGGGSRGGGNGGAFTITFPQAVHGPFALGYGSHFGLGLFVPVPD
jgi:CRISPR-associated protein Csb2